MRKTASYLLIVLVSMLSYCQTSSAKDAGFDAFLRGCPVLKQHLIWITGDGKRQAFDEWTPAMKQRIEAFYRKFHADDSQLGMTLPDPARAVPKNTGQVFYTVEEAFDLYAAHAAHVIYVEANHLVPWSIQSRPAVELEYLLASSGYVARIRPCARGDYPQGIQANRDFQNPPQDDGLGELLSDPRVGYDFVSGKTCALHRSMIGKNELATLVNLTAWLRDNVAHGPIDGKQFEREAKQRWLEQRLRPGAGSHTATAVMGCHSSAKLIVDLARSVNIPVLHARGLLHTDDPQNFEWHGGLVYGWGGHEARVVWHADEINAMPGSTCFPLDPATGALASPEVADQLFFDEIWATPQRMIKAGYAYRVERVIPGKGYGFPSREKNEDNWDWGMVTGCWKKKGKSSIDAFYQLEHDYILCGQPLLEQVEQLILNTKQWKGPCADSEVALLRPEKQYRDRSEAGLKAVGGEEKFKKLCVAWEKNRGKNLLSAPGPVVKGSAKPDVSPARPVEPPAPVSGPLELRISVSTDNPAEIVCEARNKTASAVSVKPFGGTENRVWVTLPNGKKISLGAPPDNVTQIAGGANTVWKIDISRYRQFNAAGEYQLVWRVGEQSSNTLVIKK